MFIFNNIIAINNFILDSVIYEHKLEEKIFEIIDKLNYKDMLEVIKQLNLKNKSIVIVEKKEDLGYNQCGDAKVNIDLTSLLTSKDNLINIDMPLEIEEEKLKNTNIRNIKNTSFVGNISKNDEMYKEKSCEN